MADVGHGQSLKIGPTDKSMAIQSLREELQAIDRYDERIAGCSSETLSYAISRAAGDGYKHAAMIIEWLRRNDDQFAEAMKRWVGDVSRLARSEK